MHAALQHDHVDGNNQRVQERLEIVLKYYKAY